MTYPVSEIVRDLIQLRIPALSGPTQVGFEPPDEQWKAAMQSGSEERLNIYLYELRQDLKYRSNERTVSFQNGWLNESRAPERLDCRYLITAWSNVVFAPGATEPTLNENLLLYSVVSVLMQNRPLVPVQVYQGLTAPSTNTLLSVPAEIRDESLPLETALADQIRDLGDFWGTMKMPWRPALGLTVTIPVLPGIPDMLTSPVTTLSAESFQQQAPASSDTWITIGGRVLQGAGDTPVVAAWVHIQGLSAGVIQVNRRGISRADGTFIFERLRAGQYHLLTVASGLGDIGRDIEVPSPSGEYDLRFP